MTMFKRLFGIDKLEERVQHLEGQVKLTMDRAQLNNMRTLMMLEHGDYDMFNDVKDLDDTARAAINSRAGNTRKQ
jgi:hypothetical protein